MTKMPDEWIIHYDELPVTIIGRKHYSGSWYEPDYYDEYEDEIQYDYKIDFVDLVDFLYSKQSVWTYLWQKLHPEMSFKQFIDWARDTDEGDQATDQAIIDNITELYKEHEQEILKHFENAARDEFESSDYDYTDYVYTGPDSDDYYQDYIDRQFEGYNPIEEAKKKAKKQSKGMSRFCPPGNRKDKNITVKNDAGDVEKSIEFFNNAMDVGDICSGSVAEDLNEDIEDLTQNLLKDKGVIKTVDFVDFLKKEFNDPEFRKYWKEEFPNWDFSEYEDEEEQEIQSMSNSDAFDALKNIDESK